MKYHNRIILVQDTQSLDEKLYSLNIRIEINKAGTNHNYIFFSVLCQTQAEI